jgi:hypothetical protein
MTLIGLTFSAVAAFAAQQPAVGTAPVADPQLHADVLTLVQLQGSRQRMEASLKPMVDLGKAALVKGSTPCNAAFVDEWGKRMLARVNVDDFVNVEIAVYERHFSDSNVKELIAIAKKRKAGAVAPKPSSELKWKMEDEMVSVQGEIKAGTTQVASRLGGEIGKEIQNEHPEYCRQENVPKK